MFRVSAETVSSSDLADQISSPEAGALVVFEGWVRNHNEGKSVSALEYEVYESLAVKEAHRIIEEAKNRFDVIDVSAVHREGALAIGDLAVWVGVTARHRDDAFRACRFVIDEIKHRLPIWKKEHYLSESPQWVNCQGCYQHAHLDFKESDYYEKQLRIKEIANGGQDWLKKARVLVVGAGGLGSPALTYLASAGVGSITICDGDRLEISNLHRQSLYSRADIGEFKSILAKKRLNSLNPFVKISARTERVAFKNVQGWVSEHDLVLDCTDNFETKFLLHDACFFAKTPLVQASIYQNDGQLQTFDPASESGCMRCIWSTMPEPGCVGTCVDVGVIGVVPGVVGTLQASEAIGLLLHRQVQSSQKTVLVDLEALDVTRVKRVKQDDCPLCGLHPSIVDLTRANYVHSECEIDLSEISDKNLERYELIDIREIEERDSSRPWEMALTHSPHPAIGKKFSQPTLVVCQSGIRSRKLVKKMRDAGFEDVYSVIRGVDSVRENWDRIRKFRC